MCQMWGRFFILCGTIFAVIANADSLSVTKNPADLWTPIATVKTYNPLISGFTSMILPGAGQMYTRNYFKSGTFFASEAIAVIVINQWDKQWRFMQSNANTLNDSAKTLLNSAFLSTIRGQSSSSSLLLTSVDLNQQALLDHYQSVLARRREVNTIAWAAGVYVYNILDAIGSSNAFVDHEERSPFVAGWLAAIPGTGLGQFYNGSFSKAGLVIMAQGALAVVAWNYYRLMKDAETQYENLSSKNTNNPGAIQSTLASRYNGNWQSNRDNAFQNWNQYMWYSLGFYVYSVLDAVVDAHLHDFPVKMNIEPDLVPQGGGVSVNLSLNY